MARERKAFRERRQLHWALKNGKIKRRPPTAVEQKSMVRAIDTRDFNLFGLRTLIALELDGLMTLPPIHTRPGSDNAGFERHLTAMSYAAWRRRHGAIKQLLISGADATVSERCPEGALHATPEDAKSLTLLLTRRNAARYNRPMI